MRSNRDLQQGQFHTERNNAFTVRMVKCWTTSPERLGALLPLEVSYTQLDQGTAQPEF